MGSELLKIETLISRHVPALSGQPIVRLAQSAEKSVWAVGDDYVLRRANLDWVCPLLAREQQLLQHLQGRTSLAIPSSVFIAPDASFDILRKAPGEPVDFSRWMRLEAQSQKRIAGKFGHFLAEFHNAVPLEKALSMGYERKFWPPSPEWVSSRLVGRLYTPRRRSLLEELMAVAPRLYQEVLPAVLLHADFSHHNVGFAADGRDVFGVFDFTEACIGDPHLDLRYAFTFDPFSGNMIAEYERGRRVHLSLDRLRAWHAWSALGFLALDLNEGNPQLLPLRWGWVDEVAAWDRRYLRGV